MAPMGTISGISLTNRAQKQHQQQQPQQEQRQEHHHHHHHHHHRHHRPISRDRDRNHRTVKNVRSPREESSFSEGIASLNEALNSNEMAATLNTLDDEDELDKISEPSTNSYIYCDAYKYAYHSYIIKISQ